MRSAYDGDLVDGLVWIITEPAIDAELLGRALLLLEHLVEDGLVSRDDAEALLQLREGGPHAG